MREEERIESVYTEVSRALITFQKYLIRDDGTKSKLDNPYKRQYTVNSDFEVHRIRDELPEKYHYLIDILEPAQE